MPSSNGPAMAGMLPPAKACGAACGQPHALKGLVTAAGHSMYAHLLSTHDQTIYS